MGAAWSAYSFVYVPADFARSYFDALIAAIAISIFVLVHSLSLHGRNYSSVRIQTDLAAFSLLAAGIIFLPTGYLVNPYAENSIFVFDFIFIGFFPLVVQLCDNYMFYSRLRAVTKVPLWKRYAFHLYIVIILCSSWFPLYSFVPFIWNVNTKSSIYAYSIMLPIQVWGTVAYNFYFTFEFAIILRNISNGKGCQTDTLKRTANLRALISIKSIMHCISSSVASLVYLYYPVLGAPIYIIIIVLGMHFLFNSKVEKYLFRLAACLSAMTTIVAFSGTQILLSPSDLSDCNGLKGYRDISVGSKTAAAQKIIQIEVKENDANRIKNEGPPVQGPMGPIYKL